MVGVCGAVCTCRDNTGWRACLCFVIPRTSTHYLIHLLLLFLLSSVFIVLLINITASRLPQSSIDMIYCSCTLSLAFWLPPHHHEHPSHHHLSPYRVDVNTTCQAYSSSDHTISPLFRVSLSHQQSTTPTAFADTPFYRQHSPKLLLPPLHTEAYAILRISSTVARPSTLTQQHTQLDEDFSQFVNLSDDDMILRIERFRAVLMPDGYMERMYLTSLIFRASIVSLTQCILLTLY